MFNILEIYETKINTIKMKDSWLTKLTLKLYITNLFQVDVLDFDLIYKHNSLYC